jgi:hypothetical protein
MVWRISSGSKRLIKPSLKNMGLTPWLINSVYKDMWQVSKLSGKKHPRVGIKAKNVPDALTG